MDKLVSATLYNVIRLCEADFYDYIVIGSGIGGGVLARTLVEKNGGNGSKQKPRVLLIDRGGMLFDTHCANIPSPRWNSTSLEGPSMDIAMVYDIVKSPVFTVTSRSATYVGGPVYCLGGRSTVWGLYTPAIDKDQVQKYFPRAVYEYLFGGADGVEGYDKAYRLMTNDSAACFTEPYPVNGAVIDVTGPIDEIKRLLNDLKVHPKQNRLYSVDADFECCPMAAEFTARDPGSRMYQMSMGGYSTVSWILERVFNKSEHLNVLSQTKVVAMNKADSAGGKSRVESLTVLDERGKERMLPTGKAKVILSAGTIDTATIALRSGLRVDGPDKSNLVGQGLTDHDIWGTRFKFLGGEALNRFGGQALRLQNWVTMKSQDGEMTTDDRCLLNITINAPSFLGHVGDQHFPIQHIDEQNNVVTEEEFFKLKEELLKRRAGEGKMSGKGKISREGKTGNKALIGPTWWDDVDVMIQIVYSFCAPLKDQNRVLDLPDPGLTIEVTKEETSMYAEAMRQLAKDVKTALSQKPGGCCNMPGICCWSPSGPGISMTCSCPDCSCWKGTDIPEVTRADFGVVAHEVGTMRMGKAEGTGVVDKNLQVHGWDNLFVCDLSVFPVSPSANPSLTLAALSQRLGDYLEDER